ncbi:MAG: ribosomal protein alanine N-acetyltransferase [Caulobacteraceae bacterium]|nr:ribosomal protein alanine N-acetyltransferase [Caulobacteraceae bacterium]
MALLDWITPESSLNLDGPGVRLRAPRWRDYEAWSDLRRQSRDFLQPWEPVWPEDDLERRAFRRRLAAYSREMDAGSAYPFLIVRQSDNALVGGVTLSNVRRGVAQMGTLGYWIGQPYAGQGYMTAALRPLLAFAFGGIGLHRVEAACLPENIASHRLLLKSGFSEEGLARAYLKINGNWRDHLLFGMVSASASGEIDI